MAKIINFALSLVLILSLAGCISPLIKSVRDGDVKTVKSLLDKGAAVNAIYGDGWEDVTPLMFAAGKGKTDIVKLLLNKGADVNSQNSSHRTALFYAVEQRHSVIIQMLLERGADVNIKGLLGGGPMGGEMLSPLELAEKRGHTQIVQMLKAAQTKYVYKAKNEHMLLIAVIDFEPKGLSRQDALRVSEWLRTELINTNQFRVIERSAMNAILKEQAFAMTGCTDTSCAVQVGKLLSARKMLVGSVEYWNNKVIINGRIIDVEKGVAEFAHRETVNSIKELDTGATSFAKNLARRINGLPVE